MGYHFGTNIPLQISIMKNYKMFTILIVSKVVNVYGINNNCTHRLSDFLVSKSTTGMTS